MDFLFICLAGWFEKKKSFQNQDKNQIACH